MGWGQAHRAAAGAVTGSGGKSRGDGPLPSHAPLSSPSPDGAAPHEHALAVELELRHKRLWGAGGLAVDDRQHLRREGGGAQRRSGAAGVEQGQAQLGATRKAHKGMRPGGGCMRGWGGVGAAPSRAQTRPPCCPRGSTAAAGSGPRAPRSGAVEGPAWRGQKCGQAAPGARRRWRAGMWIGLGDKPARSSAARPPARLPNGKRRRCRRDPNMRCCEQQTGRSAGRLFIPSPSPTPSRPWPSSCRGPSAAAPPSPGPGCCGGGWVACTCCSVRGTRWNGNGTRGE
jgi:hypothetical protein